MFKKIITTDGWGEKRRYLKSAGLVLIVVIIIFMFLNYTVKPYVMKLTAPDPIEETTEIFSVSIRIENQLLEYPVEAVDINWEKQSVIVMERNTGRAIVYPFYKILSINVPAEYYLYYMNH